MEAEGENNAEAKKGIIRPLRLQKRVGLISEGITKMAGAVKILLNIDSILKVIRTFQR